MASTDSSNSSKNSGTGALVGVAIAGLAVGLAANFGRKAIVQGLSASAGEWDEELAAEHVAVLKLFDLLEKTSTEQVSKRKTLLVQIKHALTKHAAQEENVIYPVLRDHGLVEEADSLTKDHGYVKQFLHDLAELPAGDPSWIDKVHEFRTELEKHIDEEEERLFPQVRAKLGDKGNRHVTHVMNKEGFLAA